MRIRIDAGSVEALDRSEACMTAGDYLNAEYWADAALHPVEGSHPKSWWTKTRIIDQACKLGYGRYADSLKRMRLEDLRACFLRYDGQFACGAYTIAGAIRRTAYYSLDTRVIVDAFGGRCRCLRPSIPNP